LGSYLIAVSPIPGHVLPLLQVGADLSERGHRVCFLTAREHHDEISRRGMRPLVLPDEAVPARHADTHRHWLPPLVDRWSRGRAEMRTVFITPLAAQYTALRDAIDVEPFDAVLCDVGFTGALPMLTSHRSRPRLLVCNVGPLTLSSADAPPFGAAWKPRPKTNYDAMTWVVHRVMFADVQAALDDALRSVGAAPSPVFLTDWPLLADRILQFTVPSMEYRRTDLPASVVFTGPVLGSVPAIPATPRRPGLPAVVHVTQGTWDNDDLDVLIRPTLQALADRVDVVVVATTGAPGRLELPWPVPANAVVTDFLPYSKLMPHVDVMITNGGYGGVHHALAHGIPLIVAGGTADKPEVAARVAHTGAGVNLGTSRPGRAAIADAVDRVLTTDSYRRAAQRIGADIAASDAHGSIAQTLAGLTAAGRGHPGASGTLVE
jgi:UDP:flavonoid glycosyltransferase YjiC (YdhE family)